MDELFERIATSIEQGEEEETLDLTQQALNEGRDPIDIIQQAFSAGVETCGRKYTEGEYFLPDLMLAGEAMKAGLGIVMPRLKKGMEGRAIGKVLMGTVEGDVHDIGKNICLSMLLANGFEIVDAGVDVETSKYVEIVKQHKPDIVGLGSYMSTTLPALEASIRAIKASGYAGKIVAAGGVAVNRRWAEEAGADGYADDAWGFVELCKGIMGRSSAGKSAATRPDPKN